MAGGGTVGGKGKGVTPTPTPLVPYSWQGATTPKTFQPKDFGTQIFGDVASAYKQGPQPLTPSYNPFSTQTRGLIDQGLAQVGATAGGPLSTVAGGGWLGGGNPYFEDQLRQTRDNTTTDVNSTFNSLGRFGSDIHAEGLGQGLANSENAARASNFENEWTRMLGAQGALGQNTATGLGYSGLLDSKNAEKIASDREQQAAADPYNYTAKYLGLLNGGAAQNTNQPTSIWDILGTGAQVAGNLLPFFL